VRFLSCDFSWSLFIVCWNFPSVIFSFRSVDYFIMSFVIVWVVLYCYVWLFLSISLFYLTEILSLLFLLFSCLTSHWKVGKIKFSSYCAMNFIKAHVKRIETKDKCLSLHVLRRTGNIQVAGKFIYRTHQQFVINISLCGYKLPTLIEKVLSEWFPTEMKCHTFWTHVSNLLFVSGAREGKILISNRLESTW
jgi:hypothetical protein